MTPRRQFEFPPELQREYQRARRLEWWTLAFMASAITLMALVMGSSQAMKTAWVEDLLSLIPPSAFLIATRIAFWRPTKRFPYGFHRANAVAYLAASLTLLSFGALLFADGVASVIAADHPTIGSVELFGSTVWLGWLMIAVLLYTVVPPVILGRKKLEIAHKLHDKVLFADAEMNKADWQTALAATLGVLGIGYGYWWADGVAGALIAISILNDGWWNMRVAVADLMNERPKRVGETDEHPLVDRLRTMVKGMHWVSTAEVRLREEGHVLTGEIFVVPRSTEELIDNIEQTVRRAEEMDWRVHEPAVVPVREIRHDEESSR